MTGRKYEYTVHIKGRKQRKRKETQSVHIVTITQTFL